MQFSEMFAKPESHLTLLIASNEKPENNYKRSKINHSLGDLIEYLWEKYIEENGVIYLLIFIAGIEPEKEIMEYIKETTNNYVWYYYPRGFTEDPYDIIINDMRILNEAFSYALKLRSMALIEYILNSWEKHYINPSISEEQIVPLLIDHTEENSQNILKFIVTKDIIIVNDGSLKLEENISKVNKSEDTNKMFISSSHSKWKFNSKEGIVENAYIKPVNKPKSIAEIDDPVLFKAKKNSFNKYLDKVDLVELAIREPLLTNNHEKQI